MHSFELAELFAIAGHLSLLILINKLSLLGETYRSSTVATLRNDNRCN